MRDSILFAHLGAHNYYTIISKESYNKNLKKRFNSFLNKFLSFGLVSFYKLVAQNPRGKIKPPTILAISLGALYKYILETIGYNFF